MAWNWVQGLSHRKGERTNHEVVLQSNGDDTVDRNFRNQPGEPVPFEDIENFLRIHLDRTIE